MEHLSSPPSKLSNSIPEKLNEELFQLLFEFKDYAILMTDAAGYITTWNSGAEHIYGYTRFEALGKNIYEFYCDGDIQNGLPWINVKIAREKEKCEYEGWKYKKDETKFYANTILTALFNPDKSLRGFAEVTRDITQQKRLEEDNRVLNENLEEKVQQRTKELEVVNKELEAFSYSVSHDLKTPLRAISGYSMMLKEDYYDKLDQEGHRILNVIVENTRMMGALISDLLSFSKMARLEIIYNAINMKSLAEGSVKELLANESKRQYEVTVLSLPVCSGDPVMLKQVWNNLIGNAIKYSSKTIAPQIEIGAIDDSKYNIYYVKDNGTGFDMKYSEKLFGVFQRLHLAEEFEGTGLGLALSKRIISKHLGEIWAEAFVGKGATFYFSIPKTIITS